MAINNPQNVKGNKMEAKPYKTPRNVITSWSAISKLDNDGQRTMTTYEVYTADYYGKGLHRYIEARVFIISKFGNVRPFWGGFSDGNQERIDKILRRFNLLEV